MNALLRWARAVPISGLVTLGLLCGAPVTLVVLCVELPGVLDLLASCMLVHRAVLPWLLDIALYFGLAALAVLLVRCRHGVGWVLALRSWRPALWLLLGWYLVVAVSSLAYAKLTLGDVAMTDVIFDCLLLCVWSGWSIAMALGADVVARHARMPRRERVLAWCFGSLLVVEIGCTMFDANFFSMAFVYNTEDQREFTMYREALRGEMFGYPFNSQGYYDKEFYTKGPGDCVVAWIADSFGLGVVPYPLNVTTVTEDRLREAWQGSCNRTDVFNFGVPQMGMKGYIQVTRHEAAVYKPDLIVLCLYTCNDITVFESTLKNHAYVQNWRLSQLFLHLALPYARPEPFYRLPFVRDPALPQRIDDMLDSPLPVHAEESSSEKPTFSAEAYHKRLVQRLRYLDPKKPSMKTQYRLFFQALEYYLATAPAPVLVALVPDEMQVDDAAWESVMADRDPAMYVRDLPQQRILEYCRKTGQPVVDLLPSLREAQRTIGNVYRVQDTHWNALGNRVAGEAVAKAIVTQFPRQ